MPKKYVYMEAEGGAMRSSSKYIQNSPRAGSFISVNSGGRKRVVALSEKSWEEGKKSSN